MLDETRMGGFRETGLDQETDGRIVPTTDEGRQSLDEGFDDARHGVGVEREAQPDAFGSFERPAEKSADGAKMVQVIDFVAVAIQ